MNYRHDFHAGNFADVFKHAVLTRILLYLQRKGAPFRVIDTHAGAGRYALRGGPADRTGEWRSGIGALDPQSMSPKARALLSPYLDVVGSATQGEAPYPGSPILALALTRDADRMIFCEVHPQAFATLKADVRRDRRAKVIALDGYVALNAFIPPGERRGLVLIDPPFEKRDEFETLRHAIVAAHRKWREGIIAAWYPIKDRHGALALAAAVREAGATEALRLELAVAEPARTDRLAASGLLVINPPYTLAEEMACLLPELARQLGGGHGWSRIDRIGAPAVRGQARP